MRGAKRAEIAARSHTAGANQQTTIPMALERAVVNKGIGGRVEYVRPE
jgi:hypothetical protein